MPVAYIVNQISWPEWAKRDPRYIQLDVLQRFLEGRAYDHLRYPFYQETQEGSGSYIPLRERRPSVIYNLPKIVVSRSTSLLFGDKHWPRFNSSERPISDFLHELSETSGLQAAFIEAATKGSIGSTAIFFTFIEDSDGIWRPKYEVWWSKLCRPLWDDSNQLKEISITYPVVGYALKATGFTLKDEDETISKLWMFRKTFTTTEVIVYNPILMEEFDPDTSVFTPNDDKTKRHGFGFVPGVWIKNLPETINLDGESTFAQILNLSVEIDYQLSQCGRALKYNADPQLLIKEPPASYSGGQLGLFSATGGDAGWSAPGGAGAASGVRSANRAIIVGSEGDAKLLEISGQAQKAVVEFVKLLKQYAMEVVRASHKDQETSYSNMSARAMEVQDEDLIGLASVLRMTYGELALKPFVLLLMKAAKKVGAFKDDLPKNVDIDLAWGPWFDPTPMDHLQEEQALSLAVQEQRISQQVARAISMSRWNIGQSDADDLDSETELPPVPDFVKFEADNQLKLAAKRKSAMNGNGAAGDDGRDSRVTS